MKFFASLLAAVLIAGIIVPANAAEKAGYPGVISGSAAKSSSVTNIDKDNEAAADAKRQKEELDKAMKALEENQQQLYRAADAITTESTTGKDSPEWTKKQHDDYQKALQDLEKQQKELEHKARLEMERLTQ
jgi:hypothetical protein